MRISAQPNPIPVFDVSRATRQRPVSQANNFLLATTITIARRQMDLSSPVKAPNTRRLTTPVAIASFQRWVCLIVVIITNLTVVITLALFAHNARFYCWVSSCRAIESFIWFVNEANTQQRPITHSRNPTRVSARLPQQKMARHRASQNDPSNTSSSTPPINESIARAATATATADALPGVTPIQQIKDRRRSWDDVLLRTKTTLLVALAGVGGVLVGIAESHSEHQIWPMSVGLIGLVWVLIRLADRWVANPIDDLIASIETLCHEREAIRLKSLPVGRQDEVGKLARIVQKLTAVAIRDSYEARRLRRTIQHEVAHATRRATRHLEHEAMRDPLTDLGNRRFMERNLDELVASCRDSGAELVCFLIDMDNFKKVNDTLGHAEGDDLLIFLANLIRASIRREDYAIRLGGDEFVVLMPGCPDARVRHFARQLLTLFRQHVRAKLPADILADLSIGVASMQADGLSAGAALLQKADENLYAAKRAGKGRSVGLDDV